MQLQLTDPSLSLETGQVVALDDACGMRISTRTGSIWVTEEGDGRDHVVGPGQALVVSRNGRTLVQALKSSWISIVDGPCLPANDSQG